MSYGIYRKSELNAMVSSAGAIDIICGPLYGVLLLGPFIARSG
jgi:tetrahydromethanopterin S-methyltransferase subunit F